MHNLLFLLRHQIQGLGDELLAVQEDIIGKEYSHNKLGEENRQIGGEGAEALLQEGQKPFGYGYGYIAYLLHIS